MVRELKTHQFEWVVQVEMKVMGVGEIVQPIKILEGTLAWMVAKGDGTSPRLKSKVIEKSEEMAKAVGDSRKESDYRWSTGTSQGKQTLSDDSKSF